MNRRNNGTALLLVIFVVLLLGATAFSLVNLSNAQARTCHTATLDAQALYAAEAALARSIHDLRNGGTGDVAPTEFAGFAISAAVVDQGLIKEITGRAEGQGVLRKIRGFAVREDVSVPLVAAVYVSPSTSLTLNGQVLSLDGQDEFAIAVAESGGENEDALFEQVGIDQWANLTGQGGSPSIGEVPPVDVDQLFQGLQSVAETGTSDLGTEKSPRVTYHDGDLHLSGNRGGAGILLVDGDLDLTGRFTFVGLIVVRGSIRLAGGGDKFLLVGSLVLTGDFEASGTADVFYDSTLLAEMETLTRSLSTPYRVVGQIPVP